MVVKSVRGRRRYVVYTVPEGTNRDDVVSALDGLTGENTQLKVITCFDGMAVIRSCPEGLQVLRERMCEVWSCSESLMTSGTLRTIRDRYPELSVPRKRKR